jgi:hypothetical protein
MKGAISAGLLLVSLTYGCGRQGTYTTVQEARKKRGRHHVGRGTKAPWQITPDGLKIPTTSCGVMS